MSTRHPSSTTRHLGLNDDYMRDGPAASLPADAPLFAPPKPDPVPAKRGRTRVNKPVKTAKKKTSATFPKSHR